MNESSRRQTDRVHSRSQRGRHQVTSFRRAGYYCCSLDSLGPRNSRQSKQSPERKAAIYAITATRLSCTSTCVRVRTHPPPAPENKSGTCLEAVFTQKHGSFSFFHIIQPKTHKTVKTRRRSELDFLSLPVPRSHGDPGVCVGSTITRMRPGH